jgi:ribosomal protein S6--L-glutamate ligase
MPEVPARIGVVGVPGAWSTERLADAVSQRTGHRILIDMAKIELDFETRAIVMDGECLDDLDAVIVKKIDEVYAPENLGRLEMLRLLAASGVRVFSMPDRIARMVNRLSCSVTLRSAGIPMPETIVTENLDAAVAAVERFGEAVLKPLYSTKARGMKLVAAGDHDLVDRVRWFGLENPLIYVQRKLRLPGRDLGVVFVGGRYLASYARVAHGDSWNTTVVAGGTYEPAEPSDEILRLAERAQAPFGLDFTCVDIAEADDGPRVFEVSAFGGFRGLQEAHGIDAADRLVEHVLKELETGQVATLKRRVS